jgi:diguanylate cyclase (GGDEF)-like protein
MSWIATHDSLTGLTNRLHFRERLEAAIGAAVGERQMALLLLDLDGFKLVNDNFGHDVGDELLVATARRLRAIVGKRGLVSRLGGDEFTVLVSPVRSSEWLQKFAGEILNELSEPLRMRGYEIQAHASVGVSTCRNNLMSASELLKQADLALYGAKSAGRGCWVLYHPEMEQIGTGSPMQLSGTGGALQ